MAEARQPTGAAARRTGARGTRELLDNTFLLKFARHNLTSTEQFELGVSLKMKGSTVRNITRDSDNAVSNTYLILEAWLESRTNDGNSTTLFDDLSAACLNISRCDLLDLVRCEQIRQMAENTRPTKHKLESQKKNFNEQMLLAKQELQKTRASLQQETTLHNNIKASLQQECAQHATTKASLQQECAQHMKTKATLQQARADIEKMKASVKEDMIRKLEATAKPVAGESEEDKKRRCLRVLALVREDGRAELWHLVSHYFMQDGRLDLSEVVTTTSNVEDLCFLLSSPSAANQITWLQLYKNPVLGEVEGARTLGAALASGSLGRLGDLRLFNCQLNDTALGHIVDGIISGCPQLTSLMLEDDKLTAASVETLRRLLRRVPGLGIVWPVWPCPSWVYQLEAEFPGRIQW